ncbi:hypothetical protein HMPREF1986_01284 [Oribacterium sp. oral taxon 078 str. F0263]|nr:hypothetical protein HMPREF1986_01284 [Oribacterium sp. oral taxon 078 str. F0263]
MASKTAARESRAAVLLRPKYHRDLQRNMRKILKSIPTKLCKKHNFVYNDSSAGRFRP